MMKSDNLKKLAKIEESVGELERAVLLLHSMLLDEMHWMFLRENFGDKYKRPLKDNKNS